MGLVSQSRMRGVVEKDGIHHERTTKKLCIYASARQSVTAHTLMKIKHAAVAHTCGVDMW